MFLKSIELPPCSASPPRCPGPRTQTPSRPTRAALSATGKKKGLEFCLENGLKLPFWFCYLPKLQGDLSPLFLYSTYVYIGIKVTGRPVLIFVNFLSSTV